MRNTVEEGYVDIRRHPFFSDVDFASLENRSLRVPYHALNTTITTDSDELSFKRDESSYNLKKVPPKGGFDEIRKYFDECCIQRAKNLSRKYWEGEVKVKRKLFLLRTRYMILFEDGTLLLLRRGHIRAEIYINERTEVSLVKSNRLSLKSS